MTTKEIINALLEKEGVNPSSFAKSIGVKPTQIYDLQSGKIKKISASIANKILASYPHYNITWLQFGQGDMLQSSDAIMTTPKEVGVNLIPLIAIDSVGGIHSQNQLVSSEQYVERMIPLPDARPGDVAIPQSGDSMAPHIPAGALLQIRKVEDWREYLGYGNVYVLWLKDDRRITKLIKRYNPDPKNYLLCCSYNPDASDEELPKSFIKEVWKVVNVLINKGW